MDDYLHRQLGNEAITPRDDGGIPARSTQRRQRMQQAVEEIEREIRGDSERRIGPYDTRPDPDWWEDFYGEGIEP